MKRTIYTCDSPQHGTSGATAVYEVSATVREGRNTIHSRCNIGHTCAEREHLGWAVEIRLNDHEAARANITRTVSDRKASDLSDVTAVTVRRLYEDEA